MCKRRLVGCDCVGSIVLSYLFFRRLFVVVVVGACRERVEFRRLNPKDADV